MQAIAPTGLWRDGTGAPPEDPQRLRWLAVPAAYLVGAVPFTNMAARRAAGVDLRMVGTGTVSGTGLFAVAGFKALAVAGILDVAKGAIGPLLAGRSDPLRQALAAGAAVSGHNWSPWLAGAGGRGISPAIGALLATAPAGAATLLAGLVVGRVAGETAVGSLAADAAVVPVAGAAHGRAGSWSAGAVLVPIIAKRLAGNGRASGAGAYLWRLLLDRDGPGPGPAGTLHPPARRGGVAP